MQLIWANERSFVRDVGKLGGNWRDNSVSKNSADKVLSHKVCK